MRSRSCEGTEGPCWKGGKEGVEVSGDPEEETTIGPGKKLIYNLI